MLMGKPYSFIKFIPVKKYRRTPENLNGVIPIKLSVITPLHVGTGHKALADSRLIYNELYRWNGKEAIPGSTLKGCVRSIAESISYSCMSQYPVDKETGKVMYPNVDKSDKSSACIICDMFGAKRRKSRVSFGQLILNEGVSYIDHIPTLQDPHILPSELKDGKLIGQKFYHHGLKSILEHGDVPVEFVKEGSIFTGKVSYRNLTKEELELLCFSLGLSGDIYLKLGYGKPAYYGSVQITTTEEIFKEYANQYKMHPDIAIQENIKDLINILDYQYAKKKSEWENGSY